MASIRRLKKDVDYVLFALISDSMNYALKDEKCNKKAAPIIEEAVTTRSELMARIGDGRKVAKSEKKAYYKAIFKDLLIKADAGFNKLSDAVKA